MLRGSKDLSVKTTTAKIIMMKQGKYIGSFAPYGFQFHPTVRNKLVIDGDSAAVVRHIFNMALQGVGNTDIARRLNREGVLTPGAYFRQKNPGSGRFPKASEKNGWTADSVLNILHQYEYTGALVGRKRYKASLHEKRAVPQDKADWIIYEGAHDAIISRADEASGCPKGKLFSEKEIDSIVFRAITQMLAMCQERKKQKFSLMLTHKERITACVAELQELEQQQERYRQEKFRDVFDMQSNSN